ncbi:MAG TPA: hypothetical protein VFH51_04520 [Myxococcota bacterium]|nr:hypothetical protein [Myxococcota bacterium]
MRFLSTLLLGGIPFFAACGTDATLRATPTPNGAEAALSPSLEQIASNSILSSDFTVYTDGHTVINQPGPGLEEKPFPTINDFTGNPGCYVACYSRNEAESVYAVASDVFVIGQIRVPGEYRRRVCQPRGLHDQDISANRDMKAKCSEALPDGCSDDSCWTGGDTGGWFGLD